jgi:hypothetical protein
VQSSPQAFLALGVNRFLTVGSVPRASPTAANAAMNTREMGSTAIIMTPSWMVEGKDLNSDDFMDWKMSKRLDRFCSDLFDHDAVDGGQ